MRESKESFRNEPLLVAGKNRIDVWNSKIEVYEVIKPLKGDSYRMRCLNRRENDFNFDEL